MKTISVLALVAGLGLAAVSAAQAQEYGAIINPSDFAVSAPQAKGFSALADRHLVRIDRQLNDEAWEGAGVGGNPNGN